MTAKTYPTILKLISGALIGGAKYEDVYMESEDDNENNGTDDNQTTSMHKIPTMAETARRLPNSRTGN